MQSEHVLQWLELWFTAVALMLSSLETQVSQFTTEVRQFWWFRKNVGFRHRRGDRLTVQVKLLSLQNRADPAKVINIADDLTENYVNDSVRAGRDKSVSSTRPLVFTVFLWTQCSQCESFSSWM